jgi:antitoxin ParD1/3/4
MTISLTPDLQQFVDSQVRDGKFRSADAAVAEAVRMMKEREEKLAWLRREVKKGTDQLDRGESEPLDIEEIKAEVRSKYGAT